MRTGKACRVFRCRTSGTTPVPIGDDELIELLVCDPHAEEIAAAPTAWKVTALPPKGREPGPDDEPVIMRVGQEPR